MQCGYGKTAGDCKYMYETYYPTKRSSINGLGSEVVGNIDKIVGDLSALAVPEDYLGAKVKKQLEDICSSFESDKVELKSSSQLIDDLISHLIKMHKGHVLTYETNLAQEAEEKAKQQANGS